MRGVFAGRLAGQEQEIPYMQQEMSHASTAGKENGNESREVKQSSVLSSPRVEDHAAARRPSDELF